MLGRTATLVGFFFQFDELLSYRLAFDQLDEGDRNANRCLQDAEHQACLPTLAVDLDLQIRIALSRASLATSLRDWTKFQHCYQAVQRSLPAPSTQMPSLCESSGSFGLISIGINSWLSVLPSRAIR